MIYIISGVIACYIMFILFFLSGLYRLEKHSEQSSKQPTVSVIIAARNEAINLPNLLVDLASQDYPKDKLEIVITDDRSTDNTWKLISEYAKKYTHFSNVRITDKSENMTPKKNALTKAIEASSGEIIVSTDADCRVPSTWVSSMVGAFDEKTGIIVGYSKINNLIKRPLDYYQTIDFLALMSANAGSLGWECAWTGSGQNLAYRRLDFIKIDGFKPVADRVSGDDFYLVQAISKINNAKYNVSANGFVKTQPASDLRQFLSQRVRWASNSRNLFNTDLFFLSFLIFALLTNFSFLFLPIFKQYWQYIPILFGLKFIFDTILMFKGAQLFKTKVKISVFIIWEFMQPIFIPVLAVLSLFGKYRWKN